MPERESGGRRPGRHHRARPYNLLAPAQPISGGRTPSRPQHVVVAAPSATKADGNFRRVPRGRRRKLSVTSITLSRASAPRSACPDHSPRSPASSPSSTTSRTSRPPRPPGRDDFREQRPACRDRPPPRPRGRERRSAPRLQGCGPCPPPAGSGRDRPPGGAPLGRCRVFSGRLRGCCTFERGARADGFRVFRTIPRLFLERRFSADGLPCAERTLLHMGGSQQC